MIKKIKNFYTEQIIKPSLAEVSGYRHFLIRQARVMILAVRGFIEDKVSIRASSLTFFTLLSVVPVVAMAFGVAKGFGFQQKMEYFIIVNFRGQEEVMAWIIELSNSILEDVEGGLLAGIGLVILVWSVMKVLTNIENSFNAIWQVKAPRPFLRKLSDYLAMMLISPFLIILSSSLMVYISTKVLAVDESMEVIQVISPLIDKFIAILPFVVIWLLFTIIYIVMPNTKVRFKYALIAGIIAGTLFQLTQWAYIHFQVGVSRYSAIYGTFAAIPLFLVWLQISWIIVLLGAEISFAYQNFEKYEFESGSLQISNNQKRLLSLVIAHYIVKNFSKGKPSMTSNTISQNLGMSIRLVRDILHNMTQAKILVETITPSPRENGYAPAIDINRIDVNFIISRLDSYGKDIVVVAKTESYDRLLKINEELMKTLEGAKGNVLLKKL